MRGSHAEQGAAGATTTHGNANCSRSPSSFRFIALCFFQPRLPQIDGNDEISASDRDAVLAAYPCIDLKRGIVRAFTDGFASKPATTFGTMYTDVLERTLPGYRRPNFCDLIAANPLEG